RATLNGGTEIELVTAANGFKVWRELGGTRILQPSGFWSSDTDWQKTLTRKGTGFNASTNFTNLASIAGRACPANVFLNHSNMTATGTCLYYDAGNPEQFLTAAKSTGIEGEDWIQNYTSSSSLGPAADPTGPSWFEGNIKTCADKGMRLPVAYETGAAGSLIRFGMGSRIPSDAAPLVGGTFVPSVTVTPCLSCVTHTASAIIWPYGPNPEMTFSYSGSNWYDAIRGERAVRCVIPSAGTSAATAYVSATPGDGAAAVTWTVQTGTASITDYAVQYSSDGGTTWTTYNDGVSTKTSAYVKGLVNGTAYKFRVAAVTAGGTGNYAATGVSTTPSVPTCGTIGRGCYDDEGTLAGGRALLPGGKEIELVATGNNFSVWREKNGTRILRATGLWSSDADWQKTLVRKGNGFSATDFTTIANIAGRVCPTRVFLDHANMVASGQCLYYDAGNPAELLASGIFQSGVESEDYLTGWDSEASLGPAGNPTNRSWYEGNIKTCADKGMRLPTMYETTVPSFADTMPGEPNITLDGIGVPSHPSGFTWTATPNAGATYYFWMWSGQSTGVHDSNYFVRCVIPSAPPPSVLPGAVTSVAVVPGFQSAAVRWTAPADENKPVITDYIVQYSTDGNNWTTFPDGTSPAAAAAVTGLSSGTQYRFRVAAVNAAGTGPFTASASAVAPAVPTCGMTGAGCYDHAGAMAGGRAMLPNKTEIELVPTGNSFSVWRQRGGTKILSATGLWQSAADWQRTLNRRGTAFTATDFTNVANIGGRACPTNVYAGPDEMFTDNRCLYYDAGNPKQRLNVAKGSGVESEDWIEQWNSANSVGIAGNPAQNSFYEGNVKTCADKGMRLPALFETSATFTAPPWDPLPRTTEGTPVWGTAGTGVPALPGSITATSTSASWQGGDRISMWTRRTSLYVSTTADAVSGWPVRVRCVIPSAELSTPASLVDTTPPGVTIIPPASLTAGSATVMDLNILYDGASAVNLTDFTRNKVIVTTLS
ncbi:hypothetical protein EBZ80_23925, partial [bacterium]|nr:hypothetical protein [bacterium]